MATEINKKPAVRVVAPAKAIMAQRDEDYIEQVKKEEQENGEELEKARKKLLFALKIKCNGQLNLNNMRPIVNSMSLEDCTNMYSAVQRDGVKALERLARQHYEEEQRKKQEEKS